MSDRNKKEGWGSRLGVILAVAGSAVGIGNFLRFPGQVAQFGGGAFMIAYFSALLLLGLPLCWAEWTMGRYAGQRGVNSIPGILTAVVRNRFAKYVGVFCLVILMVIYMYYVCIQGWCLGYSFNFLMNNIDCQTAEASQSFFNKFIGIYENGSALGMGLEKVAPYMIFAFGLNFFLIYRGLAKGIELFCKFAMPTLLIIAGVILVRVLTLGTPDPAHPDANVENGLGFMWNPTKVYLEAESVNASGESKWVFERELVDSAKIENMQAMIASDMLPGKRIREVTLSEQLLKPQLWLAAVGQIFFSLSVGFGIIATYASYLRRNDDVVLSGLSATSANEFTEVALGSLMTIPAGVAFLGVAGVAASTSSLFTLGFNVLPLVFTQMPAGHVFGGLFFALLFLASVTAGLSLLQPSIAFLEETLGISRKHSVTLLGMLEAMGCFYIFYFSKDLKALSTMDFWAANFMVFVAAMFFAFVFSRVIGGKRILQEAHKGAAFKIPRFFAFAISYICPVMLGAIFVMWLVMNVFGFGGGQIDSHITDLFGNAQTGEEPSLVARLSLGFIILIGLFLSLIVRKVKLYEDLCSKHER